MKRPVIIEVKYAGNEELEERCKQTLHQIEIKHYKEALHKEGRGYILKYGIACCKVMLVKQDTTE